MFLVGVCGLFWELEESFGGCLAVLLFGFRFFLAGVS